jgi:hypothetical protein
MFDIPSRDVAAGTTVSGAGGRSPRRNHEPRRGAERCQQIEAGDDWLHFEAPL